MASTKLNELRLDVEELKKLSESAGRQRVKDALILDMRKIETEMTRLQEQMNKEAAAAKAAGGAAAAPVQSNATKCYDVKLTNYAWDQSDKFVKVFVTLKNIQDLPKDNVYCEFTNRSVVLHAKNLENRNYNLPIMNLQEEIDVEKSHWKTKKDNVIVYLAKMQTGKTWPQITGKEQKNKPMSAPKMDPGADPSESIMGLLKQMYEDGDDDMKRTIAKAWSTNSQGKSALDSMPGMPGMPGMPDMANLPNMPSF